MYARFLNQCLGNYLIAFGMAFPLQKKQLPGKKELDKSTIALVSCQ
jgi:hypothetical protein